mmetsp:Transcript_10139/g.23734  ORF Transcript_10139/g.23734 Transcript_10139/m.23734 type:complete len:461 (-) Transcript_10139:170-1552(-)
MANSRTPPEGGDAYARMHGSCSKGRGSQSGWTPCPICSSNRVSPPLDLLDARDFTDEDICRVLRSTNKSNRTLKLFSHGRGLAAHLHVHTPWRPGSSEVKRRRGILRRRKNEQARLSVGEPGHEGRENKRRKFSKVEDTGPTEKDVLLWDRRVAQIVALVAMEAKEGGDKVHKGLGHDRSGNEFKSYRESLPPFLDAAASGNLDALKICVQEDCEGRKGGSHDDHVQRLLNLRDRNGSLALHWAAGGGHIETLTYLLDLQDSVGKVNRVDAICDYGQMTGRRRDGKTALHYAARNAQNNAIDVLMTRAKATSIDVTSNDGSTPLMLACYGGHLSTVRHLVNKYNANPFATNDWNCGVSHWTAMSLGHSGEREVTEICEYLAAKGVDFTSRQKQGHSPLHKAASKKNRHVILWLWTCTCIPNHLKKSMGEPDIGGNLPSDIWLSVGGCNNFFQWMKKECGW